MKYKKLFFVCALIGVCLIGCGKKEEINADSQVSSQNSEIDSIKSDNSGVLAGVYVYYDDSVKLDDVPMGVCLDGKQEKLITVKMPEEALFSALYTDENGDTGHFESMDDIMTLPLKTAMEQGFADEQGAADYIIMSNLTCWVSSDESYEENKNYWSALDENIDPTDIFINGLDGFYFVDTTEYGNNDLVVCCNINDKAILTIRYDGKYDSGEYLEKIGAEQVAENICNLVTIIK